MRQVMRILSGSIAIVFLLGVFPAAVVNSADDISWGASLAYGKSVAFMRGAVHSSGPADGLVDGLEDSFMRLNSTALNSERWTWVQVDLDGEYEVNYFKIATHKVYNASADSFIKTIRIEGSDDGEIFETIIPNSSPAVGTAYPMNTTLEFASLRMWNVSHVRLWIQLIDQEDGAQTVVPALREFGVYRVGDEELLARADKGGGRRKDDVSMDFISETPTRGIFADTVGTKFEQVSERLTRFGIMSGYEDGTFKPENIMTRAEFAVVICNLLNLSEVAELNSGAAFSDVPITHPAFGYIRTVADANIIGTYAGGNFEPNRPVTYEQVITVLVSILGYTPQAEVRGGYPTGYWLVAAELKITDGRVSISDDAERGGIAILICNALEVDMMKQSNFGDNPKYTVSKGATLLCEKLKIYKEKGQITANGNSTLTGKSNLRDDEVRISGGIYKVGEIDAQALLGYNVTYYWREKDDKINKVLLDIRLNAQNHEIIVDTKDIDQAQSDRDRLVYTVNSHTATAAIHTAPYVIFNGGAANKFEKSSFYIPCGNIRLLDSDGDGIYEMVFITSYEVYLADVIDTANFTVYDRLGNPPLCLDPTDRNLKIKVKKQGKEMAAGDIRPQDVLMVAKSRNGNIIHIDISNYVIEGDITEIITDGDGKIDSLVINGKVLKASPFFKEHISVGDGGTFYLDSRGEIVSLGAQRIIKGRYAWLFNMMLGTGLDATVNFKLLTDSGKWEILKSAHKVRLNGETSISARDLLRIGELYNQQAVKVKPQLIKYSTNDKGLITEIYVAANNSPKVMDYGTEIFTVDRSNISGKYSSGYLTRDTKVSPSAIVFVVSDTDDEELFGVYEASTFFMTNQDYKNVMVYDFDALFEARVFVINQAKTQVMNHLTTTAEIALIDGIGRSVDRVGREGWSVHLLGSDGNRKVIAANEYTALTNMYLIGLYNNVKFEELRKGDVIQFTERNGIMQSFRLLNRASDKSERYIGRAGGSASATAPDIEVVYGTLFERFGNRIGIRTGGQPGYETLYHFTLGKERVYRYDSERDVFFMSSSSDTVPEKNDSGSGTRMFVAARRNEVVFIVVY
ncbi:MAG: S-layer homology domain-containing protein [Firmicutes bacterium]|nr:S-layer homology domain-containing protein [Bacillota bacterium]